jgi:2Fe-2S ferredoxin
MAKITWKYSDGSEVTAEIENGINMMEAAVANNVDGIYGECGGNLSCATCHIFVDPSWSAKTGEIEDFEDAMLDATEVERQENSRLSCQITASEDLNGLVLIVPAE